MFRKALWLVLLVAAVAGCAQKQPYADQAAIDAVRYRDPGGPDITLYTMVNNRTGKGGHSALLINARERIIFDPAGSFEADIVPERNDVLFGISPRVETAYRSAHARTTFHVVRQKIPVTEAQAEAAYRLALARGAVPGAFCTDATSALLQQVPGLGFIRKTFFPTKLQSQVAQIPGVVSDTYYEGDSADLEQGIALNNAALNASSQ